jgi:hypothetical protein
MKIVIFGISLTILVASLLTLTSAPAKNNAAELKKNASGAYQSIQNENSWCPVVGDGRSASNEASGNRDSDGIEIYQHCEECRTGVITVHDDGVAKCTFCGRQANKN